MGLHDNVRGIRFDTRDIRKCQMTKELNISLGSFYRRESQTKYRKAKGLDKSHKIVQNHLVNLRITNNALLADIFLTGFKLGLN